MYYNLYYWEWSENVSIFSPQETILKKYHEVSRTFLIHRNVKFNLVNTNHQHIEHIQNLFFIYATLFLFLLQLGAKTLLVVGHTDKVDVLALEISSGVDLSCELRVR